jgi:hypothetical protein
MCPDEPLHRAEFDATIDDFVNVQLRMLERSRVARGWWRRDLWLSAVITGGGVFVLMGLGRSAPPLVYRATFALLWAVIYSFVFKRWARAQRTSRITRYLREHLGEGPVKVIIELRPQGLWTRQAAVDMLFDWKNATAVEEIPAGVEVIFQNGTVLARERGFASPVERAAFANRARELMQAARSPAHR